VALQNPGPYPRHAGAVTINLMASRFTPLRLFALILCVTAATFAVADPAPFDLTGPRLEVKVTRGGKTLPITQVPNLAAGDVLVIHPDFPQAQAAHYLLVAAFLRGSTNPPPENWFFKAETWNKKFEPAGGLTVTVPEGAQQMLLFLAPATSGDFKTLVSAVRGRPGSFVRASQDLNQAGLDRSRLNVYLDAVRKINAVDPEKLKEVSPLLARSLSIELDKKCLEEDLEQLAPCLVEKQDALILNDGHSMSIVDALTAGPAGDLAMQASYTPQASFGYYSPYIASIIDIARIMDSFHTAIYQYIPALASQHGDALDLKLNTPPSFHNPKSVLVIALPAVEAAQPPPLHPIDQKQIFCAQKSDLALPVDGAPLVFSTGYARDMVLQLAPKDGASGDKAGDKKIDLPLKADAAKGGFTVDTKPLSGVTLGPNVEASVRGYWGFEPFQGPAFHLQGARQQTWQIASTDQDALVVGRDDTVHLEAEDASCVDSIHFKDAQDKDIKADWKLVKPNQIEVKLPLKDAKPGSLTLVLQQSGLDKPQEVAVHTFSAAGHLESFTLHAGDHEGVLKGSRLDEVASLAINGIQFAPGKLSSAQGSDELPMTAKDPKAVSTLASGQQMKATVTLRDGRTVDLATTIDSSRPKVSLIGKNVELQDKGADGSSAGNIQLANQDELPQNSKLTFSLKAQVPDSFSREEKIEVATENGSYSTMLGMADGNLTLQDSKTALATLDPAKAFGASAFGPLRFRLIDASGATGDWQPLATLVRLPGLTDLKCPSLADQPCKLTGSDLFLVDSVSGDAQFSHPVQVPDGFPGNILPVPHPNGGGLYVKLRDDPSVVNQITLTAQIAPPAKGQSASSNPPGRADYVRPAKDAAQETPTATAPNQETPAQETPNQQAPVARDQTQTAPPPAASTPPPATTPASPATSQPQP
jgi:hypothetical protein